MSAGGGFTREERDHDTRHQSERLCQLRRAAGIFARLRQAVADHRSYLAAYDELNALTDRELTDLGLSRLNVRDVARDAVYGN